MNTHTPEWRFPAWLRDHGPQFWTAVVAICTVVTTVLAVGGCDPDEPQVHVTCVIDGTPKPGATVNLTYRIDTDTSFDVGLGAGFYDVAAAAPTDLYNGAGNLDDQPIRAGTGNVFTRIFVVPDVKPGMYEITAEIWPANKIGFDGYETYADTTCVTITVP